MEENKTSITSGAGSVYSSSHSSSSEHHHHHHSGDGHHHHHHSSHKDGTGIYRKKMFNHVERMRLIRKWGFRVFCIIAGIVCFVALLVNVL